MPRRRFGRFVLEALFLAGVSAGVTVADLRPAAIVVLIGLAWIVAALLEWVAGIDQPHYGRGLPPRFYVPQVALPPPRIVEQPDHYPVLPELEEERATFVDSVEE